MNTTNWVNKLLFIILNDRLSNNIVKNSGLVCVACFNIWSVKSIWEL